MSPPDARTGRL